MDRVDQEKRDAGRKAALLVEDGMCVGLGSGSTVAYFLAALGERVAQGLSISGVPTSEGTAALARSHGIKLTDLAKNPSLDIAVDGADEIDTDMNMIKGGGVLLREKVVLNAAKRRAIIIDASKQVSVLGKFSLPVEISPFA